MRTTRTITTGAPPASVYAYLKDFTTTEAWDPGTLETVLVAGAGEVGSRYRNRSRFAGREVELTYVVTDLQPERLVALRGENAGVVARDTMSLRPGPEGRGTELVYEADFAFKGLARLAAPVLRGRLSRLVDEAEVNLGRELAGL